MGPNLSILFALHTCLILYVPRGLWMVVGVGMGEGRMARYHPLPEGSRSSMGARHNEGGTSSWKDPGTGSEIAGLREDSSIGINWTLGLQELRESLNQELCFSSNRHWVQWKNTQLGTSKYKGFTESPSQRVCKPCCSFLSPLHKALDSGDLPIILWEGGLGVVKERVVQTCVLIYVYTMK